MKKNHNNILRLCISLVLAVSFCFAVPAEQASALASPGTLKWTVIDTPSNIDNVVVSPSEVNSMAIGFGNIAYAVDTANSKFYKSTDGGISWDDLSGHLTAAGATLPAWDVAIAPDNPNFVAVITSTGNLPREVFISTNGGADWQNTNCSAVNNIGAIAVSPSYGNYDIVIGTRNGAGGGGVYVLKSPGSSGWVDQGFSADVLSADFSPTYVTDSSLVIVSTDATGAYVNIGVRDTVANTTNWGTWGPVEITTAGPGTSPKANQVIIADLELPSDFSGQVVSLRRLYVSTHDANASGNAGVYRIDDTIVNQLTPPSANQQFSSIAYHGTYGAGKLLVGEVLGDSSSATVMTWITDAPVTCPGTCWYQSQKPPTGGANSGYGNARVVWSLDGSRAYCGTSSAPLSSSASWPTAYLTSAALDESAFSVTLDDSYTWNQISLIDTEITFLSDVAVSTNSEILYLASVNINGGNTGFDSLWRGARHPMGIVWERVLCVLTTSDDIILRLSSAAAEQSVFFAARSTNDMRQSRDRGQTWQTLLPGVNITDFAVTGTGTDLNIYVLEDSYVRKGKSTGQVWKWDAKVDTFLNSGHTITAASAGVVLVGDAGQGMVAYSNDGGAQFAQIPTVPVPGNMHVVTDIRIQNYIVIYAASDAAGGGLYAWVVGASSGWTNMASPGQSFYGLAQAGTLYGAWSDGASIGVDRTLNPEALGPPGIAWDVLTTGLDSGITFTMEPSSLKFSGGVDLWAIDDCMARSLTYDWSNRIGCLWGFYDCMTVAPHPTTPPPTELLFGAPSLISPDMDEVIPVDSDTDEIANIEFKWRHPTPARRYELWLAEDEDFSQMVTQKTKVPDSPLVPSWTLFSGSVPMEAGKTYYWRVRVTVAATGDEGVGEWSEVMSFSIAPGQVQEIPRAGPGLIAPANDAIDVNPSPSFSWTALPEATKYEFTLAKDAALEQVLIVVEISGTSYDHGAALDNGADYFWQVKAIEPFVSETSPVFSFTVAAAEEAKSSSGVASIPLWLWIAIALVIVAALAAFFVTRKRS